MLFWFIMKRNFLKFICLALALSGIVRANPTKNVLFLLADDAGPENILYNPQSSCKTPNLEKLAKRSVTYRNAFTAVSSCSPSRASILTGLPPHQSGQYGLQGGGNSKHYQTFSEVKSIPNILRKHGIRSGIIGKKHVAPDTVYHFDFSATPADLGGNTIQATRNITRMKLEARKFINANKSAPFFLYVGFGDPHRCDVGGKSGLFCDKFGNGKAGHGKIQDWTPTHYEPEKIKVPWYLPDTMQTRIDLAAYYTAVSRFDQGVGLMVAELESAGVLNSTLIIVTGDNGPPFVNAKTTFYEPGLDEPLLISNPLKPNNWGKNSNVPASHLDMMPTILEWFGVDYPKYKMYNKEVKLSGQSLLKSTDDPTLNSSRAVFASHIFHQTGHYYPMRAVRSRTHKLIHNLDYYTQYPVAGDIKASPTFQDLVNRTRHKQPTHWFKTLDKFLFRPEWELFDVSKDPHETNNLYLKMNKSKMFLDLRQHLRNWQTFTLDPWINMPQAVTFDGQLEDVEFDNNFDNN